MIERIIEFSARNRVLVLLLTGVALAGAWWAVRHVPLDAIPDLSDTQVIIKASYPGKAPQVIEDQVTYPLTTTLLGVPGAKTIRAYSSFGDAFVYVLFDDKTDPYWARSRVLEYLNQVQSRLPPGATVSLGPDATGVGWVFQYAVVDDTGQRTLAELRSVQDWFLRYALASVDGVAEIASIGGFVKQYQVNLDPVRLATYDMSVKDVVDAIRMSNNDVEGRLLEFSGREYMVRGRGYLKSLEDIEKISLGVDRRAAVSVACKDPLGRGKQPLAG